MHTAERRAWLALHRIPHLSHRALLRLIEFSGSAEAAFNLDEAQLDVLNISPRARRPLRQGVDAELLDRDDEQLEELGVELLPISSARYPQLLKQINDPPPLLYCRGDSALLNTPQLAMVGSRRTSRQGQENAYRFARELAGHGFTISSGLALGVDTACHRGALASDGNTVAVLGTGVDRVYPAGNRALFEAITGRGALVSEFALGTGPRRSLFPQRNRIISGMSLGVLVVEAALRSGSLITARCALEQGREVFAIPGSIHSTGSQGCHALIKQGAKLVETTTDIIEELSGWLMPAVAGPEGVSQADEGVACEPLDVSPKERQLIDLIGFDPATIDVLQQRSSWPLPDLSALLIQLELKGLIENIAGCYQRIP